MWGGVKTHAIEGEKSSGNENSELGNENFNFPRG
jgi:hypothetical protein